MCPVVQVTELLAKIYSKLPTMAQLRNIGAAIMPGMLELTGVAGDVVLPKTKTAL